MNLFKTQNLTSILTVIDLACMLRPKERPPKSFKASDPLLIDEILFPPFWQKVEMKRGEREALKAICCFNLLLFVLESTKIKIKWGLFVCLKMCSDCLCAEHNEEPVWGFLLLHFFNFHLNVFFCNVNNGDSRLRCSWWGRIGAFRTDHVQQQTENCCAHALSTEVRCVKTAGVGHKWTL